VSLSKPHDERWDKEATNNGRVAGFRNCDIFLLYLVEFFLALLWLAAFPLRLYAFSSGIFRIGDVLEESDKNYI